MGALTNNTVSDSDTYSRADPAQLAWPASLPIEIALKTSPLEVLREEYGYTVAEWEALPHNPVFIQDLAQALETVRQEGMSFRLKARLQAEELLKSSWRLIHSSSDVVPPNVKADLIKATMRWAGYDNKDTAAAGANNALSIQINLG